MKLTCVTTFFNPSGYKSLLDNYHVFSNQLRKQNAQLVVFEVAFGNSEFVIPNSIRIRSNSVMWLKERLVNYAMSTIDADALAWIDADVIFNDNCWVEKTKDELRKNEVVQLFKRVFYLPQGHTSFQGSCERSFDGIIHQSRHKNWLERRKNLDLPFASPGFAWAARRGAINLYDRDIVGSGDCLLVDSLLGCWGLHAFHEKYGDDMKRGIKSWASTVKKLRVGCVPVDIFHLWHGDIRNRGYMKRHQMLITHDFKPDEDITLKGPIFEWSSNKPGLQNDLKEYFYSRQD